MAFLAFGIAWGIVIWWSLGRCGVVGAVAAFVLMPVYLNAVLVVGERAVLAKRVFDRWRAGARSASVPGRVEEDRAAVVEAVLAV